MQSKHLKLNLNTFQTVRIVPRWMVQIRLEYTSYLKWTLTMLLLGVRVEELMRATV